MAEDDPGKIELFHNPAAAMIHEAGIVIANDPGPLDRRGEILKQRAGISRKSLATEAIVEAVAEAEDPRCACAPELRREKTECRV